MRVLRSPVTVGLVAVAVLSAVLPFAASPASAAPTASPSAATPHPESWYDEAVNPDSCPSRAPRNTLRDGSKAIGLSELCASSISQSASPHAAYAIKYALRHLGYKYVMAEDLSARDKSNRYDCSSYVSRSYQAGGIVTRIKDSNVSRGWRYPVTVEIRDSVDWTRPVDHSEALPGDLIVYYTGAGGYGHHVVMLLSDGFIAHVNDFGEITHVSKYDHDALVDPVYLRVFDPAGS